MERLVNLIPLSVIVYMSVLVVLVGSVVNDQLDPYINTLSDSLMVVNHKDMSSLTTDHKLSHHESQYCNYPTNLHSQEGEKFPGYTLKQVHIIQTPGQASFSEAKGQGHRLQHVQCHLKSDKESSVKVNNFQETAHIYKTVQKNNRQGFKQFHPSFHDICDHSHLTAFGFKQMISIGERLNSAYFSQPLENKFEPKSSYIMVESLSTRPAYHSTLSFLHGLLSEKEFAKTKIVQSLPNFCGESEKCRCPKIRDLSPFISQAFQRGRYMFKDVVPNKSELVKLVGSKLVNNFSSLELFELRMLSKCNNVKHRCLNEKFCFSDSLTAEHDKTLHTLTTGHLHSLITDSTFQTFSELNTYPFLHRVIQKTRNVQQTEKFNLYMGDNLFLQTLMTSLGITEHGVIPLASRLVMEVFRKNSNQLHSGHVYLRVLYNGVDVTSHLIPCPCRDSLENGLCEMETFTQFVSTRGVQYQQDCS